MQRQGDWIQTFTGKRFYPLDPREDEVDIKDIARALSNVCRFTGHTSKFYSVADHSLRVARFCPPPDALWGLLHDASEAYISDVAGALKKLPEFAAYRQIEARLQACICRRFGLSEGMPFTVDYADKVLLVTEARDLMAPLDPGWDEWFETYRPLDETIRPVPPEYVEFSFLEEFYRLHKKVGDA